MERVIINDMKAMVSNYERQLHNSADVMVQKLLNADYTYISANPMPFAEKRVACIELVKTNNDLDDYEVVISSSYDPNNCSEFKYISDEIISEANSFVIKALVESFKNSNLPCYIYSIAPDSTGPKYDRLLIVINLSN